MSPLHALSNTADASLCGLSGMEAMAVGRAGGMLGWERWGEVTCEECRPLLVPMLIAECRKRRELHFKAVSRMAEVGVRP